MATTNTGNMTSKDIYIPPFHRDVTNWLDWREQLMGKADIEG